MALFSVTSIWIFGFALVAALALIVVAELISGGSIRVFGPVLYYEVIRAGRRGRLFLFRSAYAVFIFLILLWIWGARNHEASTWQNQSRDLANLAESFFFTFAVIQFGFAVLLTPGYVAGCIAEDKDRRTLEFLLATDLANREIVFGKLAARIGYLVLFLLTGLPVLSLIQFFGGIDPSILLVTFAATGCAMAGLIGVSIVQSVRCRKARDAIIFTFVIAGAYVGICQLLWFTQVLTALPALRATFLAKALSTAQPYFEVFRWGDPIRALYELRTAVFGIAPPGPMLLEVLKEFAAFHFVMLGAGITYSVCRLRKLALQQSGTASRPKSLRRRHRLRPAVYAHRPMNWKEIWVEGQSRVGGLARIGLYLIIACAFAPIGLLAYLHWFDSTAPMSWQDTQQSINVWVRTLNVVLGCLILIGIAVRAAGSVCAERDKDTLASLLTTPLTIQDILSGKYFGALVSVRGLLLVLAVVWMIGLLTESVNAVALPLEAYALAMPALASAAIGLHFSVVCASTLRAIVCTLGALVMCLGGHWVVSLLCCYAPAGLTGIHTGAEYLVAFQMGLTPPIAFGFIPFANDEQWYVHGDTPTYLAVALFGNGCWLVVTGLLGMAAYDRFAVLSNRARMSQRRPARIEQPRVNL